MQIQPQSNTHHPAPRNHIHETVARTMSSREIADLTSKRHDHVMRDIRNMLSELKITDPSFGGSYLDASGRSLPCFNLDRELTETLVTGYSIPLRHKVIQRLRELEEQAAKPQQLSTLEILQIALESEKARVLLTIQVDQQATKIHQLENLFQEGMTAPQFCKKLNGVNVMQVGGALEGRSWLYNESKTGVRWRVASYARDKYMTEHAHEVTPHGKDAFFTYTPVLLKKGAIRLYELYLNKELPMKKTWDGLFTHDKELRAE